MSIHERINLIRSTSCFSNMSTHYSEQGNKYKKSFHESIKNNKDTILNFFEREPIYKDLMPNILKSHRGHVFYHKFLKNNLKSERKSNFYEGLMKAIKKVQQEKQEMQKLKSNFKHYYIIPKIDMLRNRKEKYGSYYHKKNKTEDDEVKVLKKSRSMLNQMKLPNREESTDNNFFRAINAFQNNNNNNINNITSTTNANEGVMSIDTLQNFIPNNEGSMFNNLKDLSNYNLTKLSLTTQPKRNYDSNIKKTTKKSIILSDYFLKKEKFTLDKNKKMNSILDKCEESLVQAKNVAEEFENKEKEKDPLDINHKFKNAMQSDDQKIIENIDVGDRKYQEYKRIQEQKFNNLKKNIDIKLSDKYAYMIRKELQTTFGVNGNVLAYQLYANDMSKIRKKIEDNLQNEKKNIQKITGLLDDTNRKKEFLKYKIDSYKMKQRKFDEVKNYNSKSKESIEDKNYKNEDLKGTLLPKLLELRNQCYGGAEYDFNKT